MIFKDNFLDDLLRILNNNMFIVLLLVLIVVIYNYYTSTYGFFREKGVAFVKPNLFLGNNGRRLFQKISFHDFVIKVYRQFDGLPYGGLFERCRPILVIRDPELIKLVLIRDFDHFTDRNDIMIRGDHYLSRMLLSLVGQEWKSVRSRLTPTFSSSKLRAMTPIINSCSAQMIQALENRKDGDFEVDVRNFFGRYTLDIIGNCAFGIEVNTMSDSNSYFASIAEKFEYVTKAKKMLVLTFLIFAPVLLNVFRIQFLNTDTTDKLIQILKNTRKLREAKENRRNDFLQLILDAAKKEAEENVDGKLSLDDDTINAQIILFLIAGFETSRTVLTFASYALTMHPEIQNKLREEVREKMSKFGGLTYEALSEMTYLDMVVSETMRLYPPVSRVDRSCTKDYTFPNTDLKLHAGDFLTVPISGLHMDPHYYPRPEEFIPERFTPEEKSKRNPYVYLPFGDGPRNCIGLRFALLSVKMGLSNLLLSYELTPNEKTQTHVEYDKETTLLKAQTELRMDFKPMK